MVQRPELDQFYDKEDISLLYRRLWSGTQETEKQKNYFPFSNTLDYGDFWKVLINCQR